ncbi:hypothetical protein BJP34_04235 [Moorena producens PAL-8-15-08-1]|uniref:DUF29 domain-containing protein n=1 Tax=Moorena producens PAL-8-15-08-1 TaxID=1458985 RepID=A0A1D8TMD5_9CYAN|nr:DUF29 family protein [Moorena producens]AOW98763.1 hypothetical protein BJP34_04235 [Moorena producens PAL-8-15-08-1]
MTQELIDLKTSILEGRYADALAIVDELEGMSKQAILRNIDSFIVRLFIHLIKNQVEQRLTNYWVASIASSILEIKKLNLKDNKTSYYIKPDQWQPRLEEALEAAIAPASLEVFNGQLRRSQLSQRLDKPQLILTANSLLSLTYRYSAKELPAVLDDYLTELPGGEKWGRET